MISKDTLTKCVGMLGALLRFPTNPHAQAVIAGIISEVCETDKQALALVSGIIRDHNEWPGIAVLRSGGNRSIYKEWEPPRASEDNSANYVGWLDELDRGFKARRDSERSKPS
jgi:hypothetical protein